MRCDELFINVDTPTGSLWKLVEPVLDTRSTGREIAAPGYIIILECLEELKVRDIDAEMHRNYGAERSTTIVCSHTDVVLFANSSNLFGLHESAAIDDVRLDNMSRFSRQQVQKP